MTEKRNPQALDDARRHLQQLERFLNEAKDERDEFKRRLAELEEAAKPGSVADAQTLEELAKIGRAACQCADARAWNTLGHITKQMYIRETEAILRAARPFLDVTAEKLYRKRVELAGRDTGFLEDKQDLLEWLNTKIRYRVDLLPEECPTCAKVRAALEGEK